MPNPFRIFWRVLLPLADRHARTRPLIAIWSWNDLLWPLVVNTDPEKMPLSAGLATLQGQFLTNYPVLMAGSVLASIPMIVLFFIFQKNIHPGHRPQRHQGLSDITVDPSETPRPASETPGAVVPRASSHTV